MRNTWNHKKPGPGGPLRSKQELNPSRYCNANGDGSTLSEIYARKVLRFLALKNPGILKYSSKFLALKSLRFQGQFLPNISHLRHHRNSRRRAGWGWRLILHGALGFLFQKFVHGITLAALMGATPRHGDTKWIPIQQPFIWSFNGGGLLTPPELHIFFVMRWLQHLRKWSSYQGPISPIRSTHHSKVKHGYIQFLCKNSWDIALKIHFLEFPLSQPASSWICLRNPLTKVKTYSLWIPMAL